MDRGLLRREGEGRCSDPFLYWLAEKEAVWRSDPIWVLLQERREGMRRFGIS